MTGKIPRAEDIRELLNGIAEGAGYTNCEVASFKAGDGWIMLRVNLGWSDVVDVILLTDGAKIIEVSGRFPEGSAYSDRPQVFYSPGDGDSPREVGGKVAELMTLARRLPLSITVGGELRADGKSPGVVLTHEHRKVGMIILPAGESKIVPALIWPEFPREIATGALLRLGDDAHEVPLGAGAEETLAAAVANTITAITGRRVVRDHTTLRVGALKITLPWGREIHISHGDVAIALWLDDFRDFLNALIRKSRGGEAGGAIAAES